jgi:hypothetical protein
VAEGIGDREERSGRRRKARLRFGDDELAGLFKGEHGVEYCNGNEVRM